jgi:ribosomal protein L30E
MIIHTVVCENIPNDPNWFYITPPVHSALHTNKSMDILMKQWGYVSSIYCPSSKCWVLFKNEPETLKSKVESINKLFQTDYLHYSVGFMDYWK